MLPRARWPSHQGAPLPGGRDRGRAARRRRPAAPAPGTGPVGRMAHQIPHRRRRFPVTGCGRVVLAAALARPCE
jgi:hypothetical protein